MPLNAHSRTADVTAAIRAGHLLYDRPPLFEDRFAIDLTSPLWRTVCRHRWLHRLLVRGLLGSLRPVHGWILVRDYLTDLTLENFVQRGHRQYVILGAGFDSTALRQPPWLADTRIIEVDHPATQAVKLRRMAKLAIRTHPQYEAIAVDFEHESLASGLARSQFESSAMSLFAWQGVVYYLTTAAIKQTLAEIAQLAASGSELLFDFLLPESEIPQDRRRVLSFAGIVTARMGERYISYHSANDIARLLDQAGFELLAIHSDEQLESTYLGVRNDGLSVMRGFGIAHARRR